MKNLKLFFLVGLNFVKTHQFPHSYLESIMAANQPQDILI